MNENNELLDKPKEISKAEMQTTWENNFDANNCPEAIVFEITNRCPNHCAHCYANLSIGKNTTDISPTVFNNWLDVISENDNKPNQIWLCGGEPTENPNLEQYLKTTREHGFQPMIVTTGENLADLDYCKRIVPEADEIDVTIRGFGPMHDLMRLPADDNIFKSSLLIDKQSNNQVKYALDEALEKTSSYEHFSKTIDGLKNIAKVAFETNSGTKIGLNVDIQAAADLTQIIELMNLYNVPVESIILQVQTFSETNSHLADIVPNIWRKPTADIIEKYINQANYLIDSEKFIGKIEIIDQLPSSIIDELTAKGVNLTDYYNPVATPAISPDGKIRQNVVKEMEK